MILLNVPLRCLVILVATTAACTSAMGPRTNDGAPRTNEKKQTYTHEHAPIHEAVSPSINDNAPRTNEKTQPNTHEHTSVHEVIPGKVFGGEGRTALQERIYFGIELVEKGKNLNQWKRYVSESSRTPRRSSEEGKFNAWDYYFYPVQQAIADEPSVISTLYNNSKTSFDDRERTSFREPIEKKLASWGSNRMVEMKDSFSAGISEARDISKVESSCDGDQYYIAYLSKAPVKGYFVHPAAQPDEKILLADFHRGYEDLLMVVRCVDIANTPVYNNRGIARSLRSLFEGGYQGISLQLHGFTAAFFAKFKHKTHLSVAPMKKMFAILKDKLSDDLMTHPDIPIALNHFRGYGGGSDTPCVVSCDALVKHLHNRSNGENALF